MDFSRKLKGKLTLVACKLACDYAFPFADDSQPV
jgi:hypothetical protein